MDKKEIKKHYSEMGLRLMFEEEEWLEYYAQEEAKLQDEISALMNEQEISRKKAEEIIRARNKE
jgi:hypothetical protein